MAQVEIGKQINQFNKKGDDFIIFVQEPMVTGNRAVWQPNSCKKFSTQVDPRTMIYTSNKRQAWYMESLSNRDLTVIQTKIYKKDVLLICLLYTSPSPRDRTRSRMPSSA